MAYKRKRKTPIGEKFDFGGSSHRFQSSYFHGQRAGLFAVAADIDTSILDNLSLQFEANIAKRLYKQAKLARDWARRNAPVGTGALKAGIYVTAPASLKELKEIRNGIDQKQGQMAGHSSAYFRAIKSAAVRRTGDKDVSVPGEDDGSGLKPIVNPRTQRLRIGKSAVTLKDLRELTGTVGERDSRFITGLADLLPYNPLGNVGRASLFVSIGSAMYYSAWVEYGTSKSRAQPFFTIPANWLANIAPMEIARALKDIENG